MTAGGAYLLHLECKNGISVSIGALGTVILPPGSYVYVGSARRGIEKRVERHRRLAEEKKGNIHWHIDYLLVHPAIHLERIEPLPGKKECRVCRKLGRMPGFTFPVPGFGASDCKAGCGAHLLRAGP